MTAKADGGPVMRGGQPGGADALQGAVFALNSGRPQDAERIAAGVLKGNRGNLPALHILGSALVMQGRGGEAVAPLESAARGSRDPKIETLLAAALRQAGRADDALAWLRRAVKRRPPHPQAFYELGCLLAFLKSDDEAVEVFQHGRDIAPAMPEFSFQLGHLLFARGNHVDAKVAFERTLAISPGAAPALFGLAKVHLALGQQTAAADYFRRYLASEPKDPNGWIHLGHCLLELGDREAGSECFRTAARLDPQHKGYVLAAMVKSGRGRFWLRPSRAAQYLQGGKR